MQLSTRRVAQAIGALTLAFTAPFFAFAAAPSSVVPVLSYVPNAPNDLSTSGFSHNWAGYAVNGQNVTSITGSWTVPIATNTASLSADATWIGIGGLANKDLIQTGTQMLYHDGITSYSAWYELLPDNSRAVALSVAPGDVIQASIILVPNTANKWQITLTDATTGKSFSTVVTYASSQNSAEWIEEMPSTTNGYVALDNFGSVSFTGGSVIQNNTAQTIGASHAHAITMITNAHKSLAEVGALTSDGGGFTVTRTSAVADTSRKPFAMNVSSVSTGGTATGSTSRTYQVTQAPAPSVRTYTVKSVINGKIVVQVIQEVTR